VTAARGGALLLLAMLIGNGAAYVFTLLSGRLLGPADYGVLTALLALLMILQLPMGALQLSVAREVARYRAMGKQVYAAQFVRRSLQLGLLGTAMLTAVFLVAMYPLAAVLQVGSVGPVAIVGLVLMPNAAMLVLMGDLQGYQRYAPLAACFALPNVLRLVVFTALAIAGWRLYGALIAVAASAFIGFGAAAWWARDTLRARARASAVAVIPVLRQLLPVAIGVLAVAALMNTDVLMVKARLSSEDAGVFGAASNLAKLAVFLPLAVVGVLFPRVADRRARGIATDNILGRALLITFGFCVLLFGTYLVLDDVVISLAFGPEYSEATALLPLFGIAMTCFSLANVLVSYELALGRGRYALTLALAAVVNAILLAVAPARLTTFLWVDAVVGAGCLVAYQLQIGGVFAAVQAGLTHARSRIDSQRRVALGRAYLAARRGMLTEAGVVAVAACGLAVALTWPLAANIGSAVLGGGDAFGAVAWLWRLTQESGYQIVGQTHSPLVGAPFGFDQGNGVNLQWLLPYFPAHALTGIVGEIAAYNFVVLSGLALSGAAMYALMRGLGGGRTAAAWAGFVYSSFPWLLARADGHGSLTHIWGFPLLVLALVRWREQPDVARAVVVGAAVLALCLTSGYYGVMGAVIALVVIVLAVLMRYAGTWRAGLVQGAIAGSAVLGAVTFIFVLSRFGAGGGTFGTSGSLHDLQMYGLRLRELFVPPISSEYFGGRTAPYLLSRLHGSNPSESALYVGLLTALLACVWLVVRIACWRTADRQTRFLTVCLPAVTVTAVAFALPHPLHVAGMDLPTPARALYRVMPEFRVPSRWQPVVMVGLVAMAGLGLAAVIARVREQLSARGASRSVVILASASVVAVALVLSRVELATSRAPLASLATTPAEYALVARAPRGTLAEYPLEPAAQAITNDYLVWQRVHRRPLLNGAPAGSLSDGFRSSLVDPAAPGTAPALAALGVSVIIDRRNPAGPIDLGPGYRLIGRTSNGVAVWRVTAAPGPAVGYGPGFGVLEPQPDGSGRRWTSLAETQIYVLVPRAGRYQVRFSASSYGIPRRVTLTGGGRSRTFTASDPVEITFPLDLPRGLSTVTMRTTPGPQPIPDGRSVALYVSPWVITPLRRVARATAMTEAISTDSAAGSDG